MSDLLSSRSEIDKLISVRKTKKQQTVQTKSDDKKEEYKYEKPKNKLIDEIKAIKKPSKIPVIQDLNTVEKKKSSTSQSKNC